MKTILSNQMHLLLFHTRLQRDNRLVTENKSEQIVFQQRHVFYISYRRRKEFAVGS